MIDDATATALLEASRAEANDVSRIADIGELVRQVHDLEAEIAVRDTALSALRGKLAQLVEHDIPDAMDAAHCASFKTTDGREITVAENVFASITEANQEAAFAWLREQGHGDLIKSKYSLAFGRGEEDKSAKLAAYLKKLGVAPTVKEGVHPQTLAAFVREQLAEQQVLPTEILGVHTARVAKFKTAKGAKA